MTIRGNPNNLLSLSLSLSLIGTPYNDRRASCERATEYIQQYLKSTNSNKTITHLRDVDMKLLMSAADRYIHNHTYYNPPKNILKPCTSTKITRFF